MMVMVMLAMRMITRRMMEKRRKMMMLRRKTDPKTGTHTLCELAQSKRGHTFVRACAVETHVKISQGTTLYGNLQEKCRGPRAHRRLCAGLRS